MPVTLHNALSFRHKPRVLFSVVVALYDFLQFSTTRDSPILQKRLLSQQVWDRKYYNKSVATTENFLACFSTGYTTSTLCLPSIHSLQVKCPSVFSPGQHSLPLCKRTYFYMNHVFLITPQQASAISVKSRWYRLRIRQRCSSKSEKSMEHILKKRRKH